jgi:hypothetical protein
MNLPKKTVTEKIAEKTAPEGPDVQLVSFFDVLPIFVHPIHFIKTTGHN